MRGTRGEAGVKRKVSDMTRAVALSLLFHGALFCALSFLPAPKPALSTPAASSLIVSLDTGGGRVSTDSPAATPQEVPASAAPFQAAPASPSQPMPALQHSPAPDTIAKTEPSLPPAVSAEAEQRDPARAIEVPAFDLGPNDPFEPAYGPGSVSRSTDPASGLGSGFPVSPGGASRESRSAGSDPSQRALISSFLEQEIRERLIYPPAARRMGSQGIVVVTILISEDGGLKEISLASSSGSGILDQSALRLIDSLFPVPYRPGTELSLTIRVEYRLT